MTLTPGERFRRGPHVAKHQDLVVSDAFHAAAEAALLAYQQDLATNIGNEEAAQNFFKLAGAREFLYLFMNLAETPMKTVLPGVNRLRHDI